MRWPREIALSRTGGERGGDEPAGDAPLQLQPHPLEGRPGGAAQLRKQTHRPLLHFPLRPWAVWLFVALSESTMSARHTPTQGLATAVRYKGKETRGERGLYSSFDSANDFIVGYWRTIERNRLKVRFPDAVSC